MAVLIEDPTATLPSPWSQLSFHGLTDSSPAVEAEGAIGSTTIGGEGLDRTDTGEIGQFIYQAKTGDGMLTAFIQPLLSQETAGGDQWYDYSFLAAGTATGYQSWLLANGLPMDASGEGSATATPASDGLPNLVKYALGLAPGANGNGGRLSSGQVTDAGADYLCLTYTRSEPAPAGITCAVEASPDLASWTTTGLVQVDSTVNGSLRTTTVRDAAPLNGSSKRFLRLRVTQP